MTISEQLKEAICKSGMTQYRIGKEIGVAAPILSRFLSDDPKTHRDIRLETTADKLAELLDLELRPRKRVTKRPHSGKPKRQR